MKTCTKCAETQPLDDFYRTTNTADGRFGECKACNRARARAWVREKRASDPEYASNSRMRSLYGITLEQYEVLLAAQGNACAICRATSSGAAGRRFHVDHDHACCPGIRSCGQCIRALLCTGCNTGLGSFGDDVDRLMAAAAYLLARQDVLTGSTVF